MSETKHLAILPTGKPHISFSELMEFFTCSWRHKLNHIDKVKAELPSPFAIFGSIIHASCQVFLKTRVMHIDDAVKKISEAWTNERKKTQSELGIKSKEDYDRFLSLFSEEEEHKACREAASILNDIPTFLDEMFPNWECIDAELKLNEDINNSEHKFKGYIDGIIKYVDSKNKTKYLILDWKTALHTWLREKRTDQMLKMQLILYKHFWSAKNSSVPQRDIRCAFVVLNRGAKPGRHCEVIPVSVGPKSDERAMKLVRSMFVSLHRRIAVKNKLSCTYCDFFGTQHCDAVYKVKF